MCNHCRFEDQGEGLRCTECGVTVEEARAERKEIAALIPLNENRFHCTLDGVEMQLDGGLYVAEIEMEENGLRFKDDQDETLDWEEAGEVAVLLRGRGKVQVTVVTAFREGVTGTLYCYVEEVIY